jgi:hypothetical protein
MRLNLAELVFDSSRGAEIDEDDGADGEHEARHEKPEFPLQRKTHVIRP